MTTQMPLGRCLDLHSADKAHQIQKGLVMTGDVAHEKGG